MAELSASERCGGGSILIFAPTGTDGPATAQFLSEAGHPVLLCREMAEVCQHAAGECGAILLAEETLTHDSVAVLATMLGEQPPWSDIPVTVVTSGGESSPERLRILSAIGARANVTVLERPFRRGTLLSTIEVALRARQRQYQVRNLLVERSEAQRQLEQVVKQRTRELSETNEQLETLVYSIAHDLRAPLRSMQAFANILLEDYASRLDEEAVRYAGRIVRSAEIMDKLVLDLLAYGRTARSEMILEEVDLESCWQHAVSLFEQDVVDLGATITTQLPLPFVLAQGATLSQVFANLLGNSLKFARKGVAPVIVLRAREQPDMVRVEIEDNGTGIAPEYHEKIFRVFERLNNEDASGTGIGLALVKKGVERMGGRVGVESGPGRIGSLFWIELRSRLN
jgi:signal transduction histidine kinase